MSASSDIREGDALTQLRAMDAGCAHCCITSPPYFGLRDYGTGEWEGGDAGCDHVKPTEHQKQGATSQRSERANAESQRNENFRDVCGKCGATRVDKQLGLEATPDEYVAKLVAVFGEVKRVLRDDGTLWLNLGDSYASSSTYNTTNTLHTEAGWKQDGPRRPNNYAIPGVKPKDLLGIPWAVARALREPYYTGTIGDERDRIWLAAMIDAEGCMFIHKRKAGQSNGQGYERKNDSYGAGLEVCSTDRVIVERVMAIVGRGSICEAAMDERRRQTLYRWNLRSNECRDVLREVYPHLVAKQHEARLVLGCPSSGPQAERAHESLKAIHQGGAPTVDFPAPASMFEPGWYLRAEIIWAKKNCMPESVTDRPTKAHEQVFLLSKSPRYFYDADAVRENSDPEQEAHNNRYARIYDGPATAPENGQPGNVNNGGIHSRPGPGPGGRNKRSVWTVATQPYPEAHFATFPPKLIEPMVLAGCPRDGLILDPFAGSGTTLQVAMAHGRRAVGIELNPEYAELARRRLVGVTPSMFDTSAACG